MASMPGAAMVADIEPYRARLTAARKRLATIYEGFDPARPEALMAYEHEIVELANTAERLREIVEGWQDAQTRKANILAAWELVKAFTADEA